MEKNKRNEKIDKKEKNQNEIEKAKQDLEKLIKQAEEEYGVDRNRIKVVKVKLPSRGIKYILTEALITLILNSILILSFSGYIKWTESPLLNMLYFAIAYRLIEIILRNILNIFFIKLIIKTFGFILVLPSIIAIPLVLIFTDFVDIVSNGRLLFMFTGVVLLRSLFRNLLYRYRKGK